MSSGLWINKTKTRHATITRKKLFFLLNFFKVHAWINGKTSMDHATGNTCLYKMGVL